MVATTTIESNAQALVEDLRRQIEGEVRFDKMTRVLYSTDASIYQIEPLGVVIPRTDEDVIAVIETANRHKVPILPRGGATSLAGQTVAQAIVIDFSKYMRQVLEVNSEERWARVQPGIILDELNHKIRSSGLMFAPDPSTSNRGNIGGALGNNSCGAHSIVWGKTVDNVRELSVVLSNGDTATLGPMSAEQINSKSRGDKLENEIIRSLMAIGKAYGEEITSRYPKIQRRVSGYNLDELVDNQLNLARFVVGSEGTLLTITEAKLQLVSRPAFKALAVIHFQEMIESMEATVVALEMNPAAVEMIDSMILRQARTNLEYSRMMDFIEGDPEAILLVEVSGDSEREVRDKLDKVEARMARSRLGYALRRIVSPGDQAKVWAVRKAGLGLMMNVPGDAKPIPFVEDTAVPPEALPKYVKQFDEVVRAHGTTAGYYGHASVGCLHIRPLINLKTKDGIDSMLSIADQISDLVLEFGGSISGEHGDGLVRSMWLEKMFGPQISNAFREVKNAFDPNGIMNPGKIVDPPPMTKNLRVNPNYTTTEIRSGFTEAVEMCNGQGACRKVVGGTMCPSYMVTRDEEHSTRGRANALRASISGILPADSMTGKRLHEVLDLCLECKACKAECPSNVDMAKLKYEFLDRYHSANGYSLRDRLFGNIATLSRLGSFFAPISNWILQSEGFKDLLEGIGGVDRRRELQPFASQTFVQWFRSRGGSPITTSSRGEVVLLADTFTNYNQPHLGIAAIKVLEKLGYQVIVPPFKCCGRPMLSKGMMGKAKSNARHNVKTVLPYLDRGAKLVGIEPSCILSFRDDYVDLLGSTTESRKVADNTMLVEEFFLYATGGDNNNITVSKQSRPVIFHGHCHQKALAGTQPAMTALRSISGCDAQEIEAGCCGMAGSFGFEQEHFETSMEIGEMALFPIIRSQPIDSTIVSDGVSCRQQIRDGTGRNAKHLVEILAESL